MTFIFFTPSSKPPTALGSFFTMPVTLTESS